MPDVEAEEGALSKFRVRYTIAVVAIAFAFLLRMAMARHLSLPPFITFYPAVMVVALFAGFWPGLLATGLSSIAAELFIFRPLGHLGNARVSDLVSLGFFCFMGLFVSAMAERCRKYQRQLAAAEEEQSRRKALRKTEVSLHASQAKLQGIIDSAMDAVISIDEEHRIVLFNPAAELAFRCSASDILGTTLDRFIPEPSRQAHREHIRQFGMDGRTQRSMIAPATLMAVRADGDVFPIEATISQLQAEGQKIYTIIMRDITLRKKAEARLRRFYETDLFAILYWRIDGGVIDVNDKFLAMTGYTREDLQAGLLNWANMTPPEYQEADEDARRQVRETGVHLPYEKQFIRKDGQRVWGLFSAVAWEDNREEGASFILDITARKRAEEALRASEERWSTTLSSIGDAVISTDACGCVQFMNAVAENLTGWRLDEVHGKPLDSFFNIVQEVTRIKPESPVSKVIQQGRIVGLANHTLLIQRDGNELPIEDSAAPIRNRDGALVGVVLVFHDVTDQRRAEKAVRNSDRLATTGRLAATIAHEIHNPLDAIGGLLHLIKQDTREDTTREFVSMASQELARVTQMTQQMLAFQREASKPIPVRIGDILGSVIGLYERKIQRTQIRLEQQVQCEHQILALPGELRQMFANLVGNAIEAVGPRRGTITLRAYESHDRRSERRGVRVVVADDGPGIPMEVRTRIFEPFFTTKGESGTGLGLWITADILRKYHGSMHLRSRTNGGKSGTCFSVFIPFEH